jgi:hypothetical protein
MQVSAFFKKNKPMLWHWEREGILLTQPENSPH